MQVLLPDKQTVKKAEFPITMRAIKRFDTILFVFLCLQISENYVKEG